MLGYLGNPNWRDMSEYVAHLTDSEGFKGILEQKSISASGAFGTARNVTGVPPQSCCCMSEIPLDHLSRLSKHGTFGLGFRKDRVRAAGGAPVWYLWRDTPAADYVSELVRQKMIGGVDPGDPLWRITPFVENPGSGEWGRYKFDWEREWRIPQDYSFEYEEIEFLVIPGSKRQQRASDYATSERARGWDPAIFALDWTMEELQQLFVDRGLSNPG